MDQSLDRQRFLSNGIAELIYTLLFLATDSSRPFLERYEAALETIDNLTGWMRTQAPTATTEDERLPAAIAGLEALRGRLVTADADRPLPVGAVEAIEDLLGVLGAHPNPPFRDLLAAQLGTQGAPPGT